MPGHSPERETERRFLVPPAEADLLLREVERHLPREVHDPSRPVVYVRTTYLDTDDLLLYRSGPEPANRRLRIREYATARTLDACPTLTGDCWLEFKESIGPVRTKTRTLLAPSAAEKVLDGTVGALDALRRAGAPFGGLFQNLYFRPRLTTWYRRCAFTSWRADLRVTLDADITFARVTDEPLVTPAPRPCDVVATVFSRVLEVKQTGPMPIWLADALEHCPEDSHFSKYRVGMRSIQEAHA